MNPGSKKFAVIFLLCIMLPFLTLGNEIVQANGLAVEKSLPPLRETVIQYDEILDWKYENILYGPGKNVTQEMHKECLLDCVKWFWGSSKQNVTLMMNRTGDERKALNGIRNLYEIYSANLPIDNIENELWWNNDSTWAGSFHRGDLSYTIVDAAAHGPVTVVLIATIQIDPDDLIGEQPSEHYLRHNIYRIQETLGWISELQVNKLKLNGYAPVSPSPKAMPTATQRPTAFIPDKNALPAFDIINQTQDCQLPCWNGLTPGKSTTKDIPAFYSRLGFEIDEPDAESGGMCLNISRFTGGTQTYFDPQVCVFWKNSIVEIIRLNQWNHPEQFNVQRIGSYLGSPGEIKFFSGLFGMGDPLYSIVLYYPQMNTVIDITGYKDKQLKNYVCLDDRKNQTATFILYASSAKDEALKRYDDPEATWFDWAEEKGITTEALFDQLKQKNRCVRYDWID